MLHLPDVTTKTEIEILEEDEWNVTKQAIDKAVECLIDFRKQEGAALERKFHEKINNIEALLKSIEPYEESRVPKIKEKIIEGLEQVAKVDYDRNRLEQELIYYIEKLDINEEKQRLANHLNYFRETMQEKGHGVGKKLGFIAQEMGREINTTGSKSNQAEMQNIVVKMKDELEQIKRTSAECTVKEQQMQGKLIIFSAPSGAGKSTIVQWLMKEHPELKLAFSISCTTRQPRGTEKDGVEYIFLSPEAFKKKINDNDFLEYEEVYTDRFYGTLKSQVNTQIAKGQNIIFDVDVKGGCNIKQFYGEKALSLFIQPPSIDELRRRLVGRQTDSAEAIEYRMAKAEHELTFANKSIILL